MRCAICNQECKGLQALSNHLGLSHQIIGKDKKQQYYDQYMKKENEEICPKCGKLNHFQNLNRGYTNYCCKSCQVSAQGNPSNPKVREKMRATMLQRYGVPEVVMLDSVKANSKKARKPKTKRITNIKKKATKKIKKTQNKALKRKYSKRAKKSVISKIIETEKSKQTKLQRYGNSNYNNPEKNKITRITNIKKFEQEHQCTQIKTLIEMYGQGWKSLNLPILVLDRGAHFIENKYIDQIETYANSYHFNKTSKKEKELVKFIQSFYSGVIQENIKRVIPPQELDIYLPELQIGIEYNGIYWHSTKHIPDINYHLNKSILCRGKDIRLIHIYEFEDFEEQKQLLKKLIEGKDEYPENDFNKNNLIKVIPKPQIIYNTQYFTIYGAGKLY